MKFDLAIIGHIVLDYIARKNRVYGPQLGGPCTYAGLSAKALDGKVVPISKVGEDFGMKRLLWLRSQGISISHIQIAGPSTTSFRINYHNGGRSMKVTSICDPINDEDLPRLPAASAVHIGPVLNEVSPALAMRLAESDSVVGLDPQGYVRRLDSKGMVQARKWRHSKLLRRIEVLKVSKEELPTIAGTRGGVRKLSKLGPEIVLLTKGPQGTIVSSRESGTFSVPPYGTEIRDRTGAGDALVGAFLVTWVRTGDMLWSAAVGAAVSSFVVARTDFADFGSRKQIERRAMKILDRTKRV